MLPSPTFMVIYTQLGCLLSIYSTLDVARAVWSDEWQLGAINLNNLVSHERALLWVCVGSSILSHFCIRLRQLQMKKQPSTLVAASAMSIQGPSFNLGALLFTVIGSYIKRHPEMNASQWGMGLIATIVGAVVSLLSALLLWFDLTLLKDHIRQTHSQRQFIFANICFIWIIIAGAILFHYTEGWTFEIASQFSIATILTIGYGNIVVKTDRGKILTIVYSSIGLMIVGFYLIAFEEQMITNREEVILLM